MFHFDFCSWGCRVNNPLVCHHWPFGPTRSRKKDHEEDELCTVFMRSKFKAYQSFALGGRHYISVWHLTWLSSSSFFLHVVMGFKQGSSPGMRVYSKGQGSPILQPILVTLGFPLWPPSWPDCFGLQLTGTEGEGWHHRPPNLPGVSSPAQGTDQWPLPIFSLLIFSMLAIRPCVSFVYSGGGGGTVDTCIHEGHGRALSFGHSSTVAIALAFFLRLRKVMVITLSSEIVAVTTLESFGTELELE